LALFSRYLHNNYHYCDNPPHKSNHDAYCRSHSASHLLCHITPLDRNDAPLQKNAANNGKTNLIHTTKSRWNENDKNTSSEKDVVDGFKEVENIYVNTAISAGKIQSIYMPLGPAILTLGIALVYVYAGYTLGIPGSALAVAQVGDIILFARYMMRLTFPIRDVSQTWEHGRPHMQD